MSTLTTFLLARIAEDETVASRAPGDRGWEADLSQANQEIGQVVSNDGAVASGVLRDDAHHIASWDPSRVLAECEAKRRIIALHQDWPVLVEGPETSELVDGGLDSIAYRVARQMAWLTTREYVARFGIERPTTPVLRALALPYADHQDYDPAWAPV